MKNILSMDIEELTGFMAELGEKPFRGKQIYEWLHQKNVESFDEMTNISKQLREKLKNVAYIEILNNVKKLTSMADGTLKYAFEAKEHIIESVLMEYEYGNTACISSQVGCKMNCTFCASALLGFSRNLSCAEMLAQVYHMQKDSGRRISGVVVMGVGEPLDNYENLLRFIRSVNAEDGLHIGQRHITVSTCGVIDKIYDLAEKNLQITLAVSLHAPNDAIRKKIMPVAKKYPIGELIAACKYYSEKTKRRMTFEYALIENVNDSEENAVELSKLIKNMLAHVNLIPLNNVSNIQMRNSNAETVAKFKNVLTQRGIETTVRRRLGKDIEAACGQLQMKYMGSL